MLLQIAEVDAEDLPRYVAKQIENHFPCAGEDDILILRDAIPMTLERLEYCFSHINHPAYFSQKGPRFDVLHSDQYATFLYLLANEIFVRHGAHPAAKKVFYLNKALHAFNCMYDTQLPPVFWLIHMVGAVIGKAHFGNYLVVRHGCTIGALRNEYPTIADGFIMSAGSSVIGPCKIGNNVMLAPATTVMGSDLPPSTLVSGHYSHGLSFKALGQGAFQAHFRV